VGLKGDQGIVFFPKKGMPVKAFGIDFTSVTLLDNFLKCGFLWGLRYSGISLIYPEFLGQIKSIAAFSGNVVIVPHNNGQHFIVMLLL
jgi:hypothetical protein